MAIPVQLRFPDLDHWTPALHRVCTAEGWTCQPRFHLTILLPPTLLIQNMKKFNVGIIGYGWVAGAHIAAINAGQHAQVTAGYSSRALDSGKLSAQHGSPITTYRDLKKMLANPEIDAGS